MVYLAYRFEHLRDSILGILYTGFSLLLFLTQFLHRYRVKQLREEPYTQKEAEAVVGLVTDNEGHERRAETTDAEMEMTT